MQSKTPIFLMAIAGMLLLLSACNKTPSEAVCRQFLNEYYEVTAEEVLLLSDLSQNQDASAFDVYAEKTMEAYMAFTTTEELNRLVANRELSHMIQYAFENDTTYQVTTLTLNLDQEESDYVIYHYTATVKDTTSGLTSDINGSIKAEKQGDVYRIVKTDLGKP